MKKISNIYNFDISEYMGFKVNFNSFVNILNSGVSKY